MEHFHFTGEDLSPEKLHELAKGDFSFELSDGAKERITRSRAVIDRLLNEGKTIYGVNTGFGKLCDTKISEDESAELQRNIVMSHACGVGQPLQSEIVRMVMIITVLRFTKGHSGVSLNTAETMLEMVNKGVVPVVPEKGSLGASGDLVPLAHIALVLIGMGEAHYQGERLAGAEAMKRAGIKPAELGFKEGLALLNGTQVMTSLGISAIERAFRFYDTANMAAALTIEALGGHMSSFDPRIHNIRPHKGQISAAERLRALLAGSKNTERAANLQDAYSIRCIPQVHGASLDALNYVRSVLTTELNSVTDNPLVFPDEGEVLSGGNFHGQPLALSLDFLAIALSELANISERRVERLVNPALSGLSPFLVKNSGLNSGMMIAQYTAAALVSENKIFASPASVDSIPSSGNQEDHVSMGSISARKLGGILDNLKNVLAIELMCAAQAIDLAEAAGRLGGKTKAAYESIRKYVPALDKDRTLYTDMAAVSDMVEAGTFA